MMPLRQLSRRNLRGAVLRLVLIVCAWQGPLPYWHAHGNHVDADSRIAAESSAGLAEHLRTCHPGGAACSGECLHGHWHLEYPHNSDNGEPGPHPAKNRLATLAAAGAVVTSADAATSGHLPPAVVGIPVVHARALVAAGGNSAEHFFDGFAPTLPPPLRFCVARC